MNDPIGNICLIYGEGGVWWKYFIRHRFYWQKYAQEHWN